MKKMTVSQLHKQLSKLVEKGQGYKTLEVFISKTTFQDRLEDDGVSILPVVSTKVSNYPLIDADGAPALRKDGSEKHRTCFVLLGEHEEEPVKP